MSAPVGNANRAIAVVIRGLISSYLVTEGFDTTPKPYSRKISDSLETALDPDVTGLPGVHLDVSSRLTHRLSEDLDAARRAASINGTELGAFVQYRPERSVAEAYVVLGLDHFAKLLRAAGS